MDERKKFKRSRHYDGFCGNPLRPDQTSRVLFAQANVTVTERVSDSA